MPFPNSVNPVTNPDDQPRRTLNACFFGRCSQPAERRSAPTPTPFLWFESGRVASLCAVLLALAHITTDATVLLPGTSQAAEAASERALAAGNRIAAAYPDHIVGVEGGMLRWRDGSSAPLDDGLGDKSPEEWLTRPDIEDMLRLPYPAGAVPAPPPPGADPGRARNADFFARMYGDCRKGEVARHLVDVVWLPKRSGQRLKVTSVNGVAERLAAVIRRLDSLPAAFDVYLVPSAGTYNCRTVAGTPEISAHGYGIAIDIAIARADYWRWRRPDAAGQPVWRNAVPPEIVAIFEDEGFIWGGRWHHFDTMHFEYRPELLPPRRSR